MFLPALQLPHDDIDALLELPAQGTLHVPITVSLRVRNREPLRTADVFLQLEPSDSFVVSGLRSGSLPILLPGAEDVIVFNLIPIVCGAGRLPTIKLFDRRSAKLTEGQNGADLESMPIIPVFDKRIEERDVRGDPVRLLLVTTSEDGTSIVRRTDEGSNLFVLPP